MKNENFFTAGQFARLHRLNKRTLHYYDDIGLFSPAHKGENGYRYYTYRQSAELENILALRELGMSIEEIRSYLKRPDPDSFLSIAAQKTHEIDEQIRRLKSLKTILREKRDALVLCDGISDGRIEVARLPQSFLLLTPMELREVGQADMGKILEHLQLAWACSPCKTGCGSYISIDKARRGDFEVYDGLFTSVIHPKRGYDWTVRPKGEYLCGYCVGDWARIPALYRRMFDLAEEKALKLTGKCYEIGLNEFAIADAAEYVTQITIQCETKSLP